MPPPAAAGSSEGWRRPGGAEAGVRWKPTQRKEGTGWDREEDPLPEPSPTPRRPQEISRSFKLPAVPRRKVLDPAFYRIP